MLKFINESDFLLVNQFKENEGGSVKWIYNEGENLPTHSGIIYQGMTRSYSEQTGTETVVVGQTEPVYEYDEETGEEVLVTPAQDITEEQPVFEEVTINVWDKLQELVADGTVTIEPYVVSYEEQRQALKQQRDAALQDMVHDFGDGRIVQVRPQDKANFEIGIAGGVDEEWIAADNSIVILTVAEMEEAMQSGIMQGRAIYANHISALNNLNTPE